MISKTQQPFYAVFSRSEGDADMSCGEWLSYVFVVQDGREGGRGYRDGDMRGPRDDGDRGGFRVSVDSYYSIGGPG